MAQTQNENSIFGKVYKVVIENSVETQKVSSPDGRLVVDVVCDNGAPAYSVSFDGKECISKSALGLNTNVGDYSRELSLSGVTDESKITDDYTLYNIKNSKNHYEANTRTYTFAQKEQKVMEVEFQVSNNNIAFRYHLLPHKETKCCVINTEATGFNMTDGTTTFMCPQMGYMTGFARTAPSYETHYEADGEMGKNGWGQGYTFPCLFRKADGNKNIWILVSETGVDGTYCASRLDNKGGSKYQLTFPGMEENNGYGSNTVQAELPSYTPWRTITVGDGLKNIVETTITWDVLKNDVKMADRDAAAKKYGRGSWSWIIANDESCNFDTQKEYIDFSAAMGWESLLVDAMWDVQIGRDRIAELAKYGKSKGVNLFLWYNSNGKWNDAPQTPRNCMDVSYRRRAEMKWMQSIGIRGIKVDFFGGDKQCTMQLYEDILRDAQEFGLMVIFHGCTLPRGWERMYPNYAASEAVRASENLHFNQSDCDREAKDATFLPFLRNTVGSMDFGGSTLNWYYNPKNSNEMWGGHRVTSDVFALATAILFQSPVQHFAMAPNNLKDAPQWAVDFMKNVPTTWDEVKFIDGYPGKYVVLARRTGDKWYIAGINAEKTPLKLKLSLPMLEAGKTVDFYNDDAKLNGGVKQIKISKKKEVNVVIPCNGGFVIK
ncbi:MAG: glycoside hydrolase family 97 protein [Bacteroidaceae bacterium]|nr:glycoside hydrolase family 97 protein [Bacteroidaceae bacterium]